MMKSLPYVEAAYRVTILIAPSPSNWPRWPSLARWYAPSAPPSAVFERHRYAHDREHDPNRTKAAGDLGVMAKVTNNTCSQ
jgi:hypothetical protein